MSEWVSIKTAAERLGISPDTVRRRLKRGELQGRQESTAQGFVWQIELPRAAAHAEHKASEQGAPDIAGDHLELVRSRERIAGLERLTDELKSERDSWREQAQRESEAARELRVLLRNEQMRALPQETTRQDGPGVTEAPAQDAQVNEPPSAPASTRRSFWGWFRRT